MSTELQEGQLIIPKSRLSYPHLWEASLVKGEKDPNKKRFSARILLPKEDTATKARIDKEIKIIAKERMKGVMPEEISMYNGDGPKGDEHSKDCWIISANRHHTQGHPQVVDAKKRPLHPDDGQPKAGDVCNFLISAYNPKEWPKKVCFSLEIVQYVKDGPAIGAGVADVEVMPEMPDEEGDDFGI